MNPYTVSDLTDLGYSPSAPLSDMVAFANQHIERGVSSPKYLHKLLARSFGPPTPPLTLRSTPLPYHQALRAHTPQEHQNLDRVHAKMSELLRCPKVMAGAIMPDACPAGSREAEIPVGGGIVVDNAIIPAAHSSDICCSLYATFYETQGAVAAEMDALQQVTKFGPGGRAEGDRVDHPVLHEDVWGNPFLTGLRERAAQYMADQGDGNHFAFLGEITLRASDAQQLREAGYDTLASKLLADPAGEKPYRVLVTHHGSRGIGAHLYKRGLNAALKHTHSVAEGIPEAAAWLDYDTPQGQDYWAALQYVSRWTLANHQTIHTRFLDAIGAVPICHIGNEHNFVWKRGSRFYHGKGATPAWKDSQGRPLLGLIPLNMAEPILLVSGRDQSDYLSFAPHGAGRNTSRTRLKRDFYRAKRPQETLQAISEQTAHLDIRWYLGQPDITESPIAYKNPQHIRDQLHEFGLADVIAEIQPLGCIMAGSQRKDEHKPLTPKQRRQLQHRSERRSYKQSLNY